FGVMWGGRPRTAHHPPAAPSASGSAGPAASAAGSSSAGVAGSASGALPDGGPGKLMDRPLRVIALGWDLAAPGLLANGGPDPSANSDLSIAGIDVHVGAAGADAGGVLRGGLVAGSRGGGLDEGRAPCTWREEGREGRGGRDAGGFGR